MMRIICFIFSIFLLSLSFQPCADSASHEYENGIVNTVDGHDHDHHSDDEHTDNCSPFCSCSCCGVVTIKTATYTIPVFRIPPEYSEEINTYQPIYSQSFSAKIWQPPKTVI